jgi:hypothetical protein
VVGSERQLAARGDVLRAAVAEHKSALKRHRQQLRAAAAALAAWEAECRRRGIAVIRQPAGEGVIHGHQPRS